MYGNRPAFLRYAVTADSLRAPLERKAKWDRKGGSLRQSRQKHPMNVESLYNPSASMTGP